MIKYTRLTKEVGGVPYCILKGTEKCSLHNKDCDCSCEFLSEKIIKMLATFENIICKDILTEK